MGDSFGTKTLDTPINGRSTSLGRVPLVDAMEALEPVDSVWAGPHGRTIVTSGRVETITAGGASRFRSIREQAADLFGRMEGNLPAPARPRLLGGFAFFGAEELSPPWKSFSPAAFHLPSVQVVLTEESTWVTALGSGADSGPEELSKAVDAISTGLGKVSSNSPDHERRSKGNGQAPTGQSSRSDRAVHVQNEVLRSDRERWTSRVEQVTERIASSSLRKAVLAQALDLDLETDLPLEYVLDALETAYPDSYKFAFHGSSPDSPGSESETPPFFFGASPETLVKKVGPEVSTEALAGTVDRGETPKAEERNAEQLQADPKIQEEHALVVDRIEHQLSAIGDTVHTGERSVRKLPTVQHLKTPLSTRVEQDVHVLDIVEALHPTPAVGGMPIDAAKAVIHDLESIERGWYAAPVGWIDERGDGTFAVAIRSALSTGDRATLFAGNGIVADSDPSTEWNEVTMKFRPIQNALR